MRKLGYEITNGVCKGDIVWTLKDKKVVEANGCKTVTKLFNLPEELHKPKMIPWIVENGKLVRQHV